MLAFLYAESSNRLSNQLRTKTTSWGTSYKHMDTDHSLPDFRNHRNHSWIGMVQLWTTPSRWKRVFLIHCGTVLIPFQGQWYISWWRCTWLSTAKISRSVKYAYNREPYSQHILLYCQNWRDYNNPTRTWDQRTSVQMQAFVTQRQKCSGSFRSCSSLLPFFNRCCIWGFTRALQNGLLCYNEVACNCYCKN